MEYTLKKTNIPLNEEYDVIVCGGGPAGIAAAISAAREGAKTLLLEGSGCLGGMSTNGLVNMFTNMSDGIRNVYGGLADKLVVRMKSYMPHVSPDEWRLIPIDFERMKQIYDEEVIASGAHILFHSTVCGVEMKDDRNIDVILVSNKKGLTAYKAKVYVDCTGDADLYAWAGKEYDFGNGEGDFMPGSMCFTLTNVDEYFQPYLEQAYGGKHRDMIKKILADGKYNIPDDHYVLRKIGPRTYTLNAGHVFDLDATDPESLSKALIEGRRLARELHDAFKEYAPCMSCSFLVQTSPMMGIRESRRIIGDYRFTGQDYLDRRSFADEVYRGKYQIDVHARKGSKGIDENDRKLKESGVKGDSVTRYGRYGEGESYGVPYRCLCPRDLDNVLVAGRTISSDRVANGTLRVMSSCLCAGEAAGMAAKHAMDLERINIHNVDTQKLRRRLIEEGAYLPKYDTDTF